MPWNGRLDGAWMASKAPVDGFGRAEKISRFGNFLLGVDRNYLTQSVKN
jgi:hypothetical protein